MESKNIASAIAQFSNKFCNQLEKNKSVVSSPLSAEFVLSLLALGTSEPAHSELLNALDIPNDDSIRSSFSHLSGQLKSIKGVTLNVANKVYVKDGSYKLVPQLEQDAVKVFDAAIEKINFDDGAAAASIINKWVESKTNNCIKDLLSPESLNSDSRLVLVNALYFKGTWKKEFNPRDTIDMEFNVNLQKTINIPMMYLENDFRYGESEELGCKLLELPYQGDEASMLVVLPNEVEGLNPLLQKLASGFDLMSAVAKMYSTKVRVTLPKFKIETKIDLKELLPKLGIKAIFSRGNSGLTRILDNSEPLFVSEAVQKAFIEVNEEGAEAAAATGMVMMLRCARMSESFLVDRPALFVLTTAGHVPLFIGYYAGPDAN